ncbi:tetratricopeptide repeat protein [Nocardia sp. 2YAB30]|uniref:tetratricopeptide repeat protein n=1 Tax=Nocardia sp. 2YAB30 TaxID=3233022 RepID=UPI003F9ADA92
MRRPVWKKRKNTAVDSAGPSARGSIDIRLEEVLDAAYRLPPASDADLQRNALVMNNAWGTEGIAALSVDDLRIRVVGDLLFDNARDGLLSRVAFHAETVEAPPNVQFFFHGSTRGSDAYRAYRIAKMEDERYALYGALSGNVAYISGASAGRILPLSPSAPEEPGGDAIARFQAVVAYQTRILGADHQQTLLSRAMFADTYRAASRFDEAITLLEAHIADHQRLNGADHQNTLNSRRMLGVTYIEAGRFDLAAPLWEAIVADYQRVLGADHKTTVSSNQVLAVVRQRAGR